MTKLPASYVAVDLGAGSGRVVRGRVHDDRIDLDVLGRFANEPRVVGGHERWDVGALWEGVRAGLAQAGEGVVSVGVDTWGVDYGLFDAGGALLEDPVCYRDERTAGAIEAVRKVVSDDELFARTGVQRQPFNTLYQVFAQVRAAEWPAATARMLLLPDVFHYWLSGEQVCERTMASTSQLLDARSGSWDRELLERLQLPFALPEVLIEPGTAIGPLRAEFGRPGVRVVVPAGHDTASAVAGTPLRDGFAFLSSGTWSLLGVETAAPVLSAAAAAANLTNEAGVGGSNRLLKNIMGLWILESCRRVWAERGDRTEYATLLDGAARSPGFQGWIDPDDARFFHPDDMVEAVRGFLRETGQPVPSEPPALARIVLESLALRYAQVVDALEAISGQQIRGVHVIGGGSQNDFLNQATADATGREVIAGPVEATALGNVLVQAIADGRFADLAQARAFVAGCVPTRRYEPQEVEGWRGARQRFDHRAW